MFPLPCSPFSWMLGTWNRSWLRVRHCFQTTHQCGSKTWPVTSTIIWLRKRLSPHSAATLTVSQTQTLFRSKARLRMKIFTAIKFSSDKCESFQGHWYDNQSSSTYSCLFFLFLSSDYPYCLTGKELKGVIKDLFGRCGDALPDFFNHCVYTMFRELDRQSGTVGLRAHMEGWQDVNDTCRKQKVDIILTLQYFSYHYPPIVIVSSAVALRKFKIYASCSVIACFLN